MDRVSVAEAARRLGISQDAVYKRIKRGSIPGIRVKMTKPMSR